MNFKDQADLDIDNVFFSNEEFADIHCLNGVNLSSIKSDEYNSLHHYNRTDSHDIGLIQYDVSLVYKTKDYPHRLVYWQNITLDGLPYRVFKWSESQGVVTLHLAGLTG